MKEPELPGEGEDLSERWSRAVLERAWWSSPVDRDRDADELDAQADARDLAAGDRDRTAVVRDEAARQREDLAVARAVAAIRRLALADRSDAQRWAGSLALVDEARARAAEAPNVDTERAVRQAEADSDALMAALIEAAMLRDDVRDQLEQLAQFLRAAARDRQAARAERESAEADRAAARADRNHARSDRQQSALDRARGEPPDAAALDGPS